MQKDFHYYATYCAARLAGYSHEEGMEICYSAQLVDLCSATFLASVKGPTAAATTQLQLELMESHTDPVGLQDITRIWASFHFLPYDLHAEVKRAGRSYKNKFRLICRPNGELVKRSVELARGKGTQAAGIAMHVLADTWAHSNFAGTPSLVINNTEGYNFVELIPEGDGKTERPVRFRHSTGAPDDPEQSIYTNSIYQWSENSIMNLGHGRAGHLPDYSFIRYRYLPAWGDYEAIVKDNPREYYLAFCQMVYALKYLRGEITDFSTDSYDTETVMPWENEIRRILEKRQLDACDDWRTLGERIGGRKIEDFDLGKYQEEYRGATVGEKDSSYLGAFFLAALAQKSMVTNAIFRSGSLLAGFSVDFAEKGFRGIRDYRKLLNGMKEGDKP